MHFYRPLNTIKALTFDLDDTLYDNSPFMVQAEAALMKVLQQIDGLQHVSFADFSQVKRDILIDEPDIFHDVLVWRAATLRRFLRLNGIKDNQLIEKITNDAMDEFVFWRNKVIVPQEALKILDDLSSKYPLGVITNGNADIEKIGLKPYFQFSLRGGEHGYSKPFPDIFEKAAMQLNVPASNILHVGDSLYADVLGAINSGMQSCWINIFNEDIYQLPTARVLPHVEIIELSELNYLL